MDEVLGVEKLKELLLASDFTYKEPVEMHEFQGVLMPVKLCTPVYLEELQSWKSRPEDVFIVTYPKAGTTWMQEVVSAILHEGDLDRLMRSHTMFRVPFLEATHFNGPDAPKTYEIVDKIKSPRSIKSHLPGHLLPPDIFKKKARIVYVARNPKDVCVSYYYFHIMNSTLQTPKSWDEFFEDYSTGKVTYGSWWEHYLYYWNRRHEPNVLFLKFEDMKRDLKIVVQRVVNFMNYTISEEVIDRIVDHCSFNSMKSNKMTNPDTILDVYLKNGEANQNNREAKEKKKENPSFMRKGKVGDWRNHFTVAQQEAFDAQIKEKLAGSGLTFES